MRLAPELDVHHQALAQREGQEQRDRADPGGGRSGERRVRRGRGDDADRDGRERRRNADRGDRAPGHARRVGVDAVHGTQFQRLADQASSDQREADQREADHRDASQRLVVQSASDHREADHREADQRAASHCEFVQSPVLAHVEPVQVAPFHVPPFQADRLDDAAHHVAGFHGMPCTSTSPEMTWPLASTRSFPPRAASIEPWPVDGVHVCVAAGSAAEQLAEQAGSTGRLVQRCGDVELAGAGVRAELADMGLADEVSRYLTWSGVRFG